MSNLSNFMQNITTLIKTFYSSIIVSLIAVLVVSCASSSGGGGGGGGPTTRSSIFSHSSYTFLHENANITSQDISPQAQVSGSSEPAPGSIPRNATLLGSVLIKEAEINKLVAAEINKLITAADSKVDANDISINNNYTIKYTFTGDDAKDPSSTLSRYLDIVSNIDNRGARIYVSNPFAFQVSLADILADIPLVEVTANIALTLSSLVKAEISIVRKVPVHFPEVVDTLPNINEAVTFDISKVFTKSRKVPQKLILAQSYTGNLSGSFPKGTAINGSDTLAFTSLWEDATNQLASQENGTIEDNTFKISDLLNVSSLPAADIGIIQRITITLTPEGASEFDYTYPDVGDSNPTANKPASIDFLNANSSTIFDEVKSLWKAISDKNSTFTETNDDGIHVLNISIGWRFTYTYQRDFQPDDATLPDGFVLNRTVLFDEEQAAITTISIDGVNNPLNRYGFAVAPGDERTIFFALLDSTAARDPSSLSFPLCSPQSIYLDNIDTQVKSATSFNYEDIVNEEDGIFKCVLGASFYGANYQPLVAEINKTTTPNSDSNPISGFTGCSTTEDVRCYYASLTINITNIDEAPTITAPPLSIPEGVGPTATDYPGVDFTTPALGTLSNNDAATGNLSFVLGEITIADTDEKQDGRTKLPVNAAETKVMSVSPSHGKGLFSIVKQDMENNLFNLSVDASKLDFEKFVAEGDLNTEGKAIYMVTIATKDTDGTMAKVKTMQVPVEITDVKYAPVILGEGLGFTKAANIENRSSGGREDILLLSGSAMIAANRNTLGIVKAVNPETDSDNELFYTVTYENTIPSHITQNFAVVSGFGDGRSVQNLELNKLGLVNGSSYNIVVQAFYRPANFDRNNLVNISALVKSLDIIPLRTTIIIDIVVDDTAYSNKSDTLLYIDRTKLLNPAHSPVFRKRLLTGSVTEATKGDNVTGVEQILIDGFTPMPFDFPPFDSDFIDISQAPANLSLSPTFALVGAGGFGTGFGAFTTARLRSLGIDPTHSSLFSINSTTGAISLQGESTVEFPDSYSVVVRLANATDIKDSRNPFSHDYATVNILVNDKNTAPSISKFNDFPAGVNGIGSYNKTTRALTLNVTINENTPIDTVLARFTVTDDNDDMFAEHEFTFGANTDIGSASDDFYEGAVKLTFEPAASVGKQKVSTATLTLVKHLSFEDFASTVIDESFINITDNKITLNETRTISDKGKYEHNPLTQSQPEPISSPADNPLSASLAFNLVVLDVDEKPLIDTETSVTSGSVMEDAPVGSPVAGILINIANINETDADALVYELGDEKFDEVFDVNVTADGALELIVADADKLENLGDGLVHTSTLMITNNTGGMGDQDKSAPITIQVRVIDVLQPINPIVVNMTGLQVKETDVDGDLSDAGGDKRHVIKDNLFVYKLTDVSKDADDFFRIGRRKPAPLVTISYAITDVSLESSTPNDATDIDVTDGINFDTLSLLSLDAPDGNNNVGLAIDNTDYVEASLFGNITATLAFTGSFIGGVETPVTDSTDFIVDVIKANPKNVEYNTTSDNAPVYTFEYTQSNYGDEITADNVGADTILASAIANVSRNADSNYGGLTAEGARPQINLTGDTYNTALVRLSDDDADVAYFIERDFTRLNKIQVTKNNQQKADDGVIVIPFTSNKNITVENIQVLSEDASGKLEDSADSSDNLDNFHNYFDIKVNNTYNFASEGNPEDISKALLITQKQLAVINSSGVIDETNKYNTLDTIPLFEGETQTTSQTYYIRVSQGDTPSNASNYALAQVHLNIEAAELNIPAVVRQLYIGEICCIESALTDLAAGTGNIGENSITPNAFGTHFLYINITNQDYDTEEEGNTTITISVPTGEIAPTPTSNVATNGQLIGLSSTMPRASNALPGANIVTYTQGGTDKDRIIRFALARNVYGSATINVHIQENDAEGNEIDSNTHTFTLNVNEDTSGDSNGNNAPTITTHILDNGEMTVDSNNLNLDEDTGLLEITDGTESRNITIIPEVVTTNDGASRNQTVETTLASVVRNDGFIGTSNTKKVDVFDYDSDITNNNIITYQKHGWGITAINYRITETEPRGFGDTVNAVIYNELSEVPLIVTVAQVDDDAVLVEATTVTYNLNEFETSQGSLNTTNNIPSRPITLTYSDPDLRFSNFSVGDAVPAKIIPGTQTRVPSSLTDTLAITPAAGTEPVEVPNSELFTVTFTSDFSTISQADYNTINSLGDGGLYIVPFTGDNAADANTSIRVLSDTNNHTIGSNSHDVFKRDGAESIVSEGSSTHLVGLITIQDLDFTRNLDEPETITFSVDSAIEQVREGSGDVPRNITSKVRWTINTIATTTNSAISSQINAHSLTDADVGDYTVTWSTTERYSAAGGPRTLTGFFTLKILNTIDPLILGDGDIIINYPHDGMGALSSEINRTIATIEGINITSRDMNLPAERGYGILLAIEPKNIDIEGVNSFTNASGAEVSVIELLGDNYEFDGEFNLKHFISFSDIMSGGDIPAFRLVVDDELAGDEFNILVNATLAISHSGATEDAMEIEMSKVSSTLATGYDIQSPPSDVEITTPPSIDVTIVADEITTTEGRQGFIDVDFTDKNIEGGELEEFAGDPIDAFNLTMVFYNSDKTERKSSIEIIDPGVFVYSEDTGSVQIFLPNANADVGTVQHFEITVTDNRTKNAPAATLEGTLNIIGADSDVTVATQLMTDMPGVTQELNYNNNDDIAVLVTITSEDFVEGGGNYNVSDFVLRSMGLLVVERGQDLETPWNSRFANTCVLDNINFNKFQDITDTIEGGTDEQRFLKFTIGVQELDEATTLAEPSVAGGICARLDYDIVGTSIEGFDIQLNNGRPLRDVPDYHNSQGIVARYSRTGIRNIPPTIQNLVTDGLEDVRYATGRSASERTFTVHANFSDGDPGDNGNFNYVLTSSNDSDCKIGDEFDNTIDTTSWNIELSEGIAIGTRCMLTLTVTEGINSVTQMINIQVPKSLISFSGFISVTTNRGVISPPYDTGILAGDNVSINFGIQDNDGNGDTGVNFVSSLNDPDIFSANDMCMRVNSNSHGTYDDINRRVTFDITVNKNITTNALCQLIPLFNDEGTAVSGFPNVTVTFVPRPTSNVPPIFLPASASEVSQFTPASGDTLADYSFANILADSPAGYSVGNVSASDANLDTITYAITDKYSINRSDSKVDNTLFQIDSTTGEITLQVAAVASNLGEYKFNTTVSDDRGNSTTATISVSVIDSTPPEFTSTPYNFDLPLSMASTAGIVVGSVSAVDAEGTPFDYSLDYSLPDSEDFFELAPANNADGSRNIILRRAVILSDFAAFPVTFQVVATLQVGGFSAEADVTVNLNTDSDGDDVMDFYDADPNDNTVSIIGNGDSNTPYIISNIYQLQAIAGFDHAGTALGSSGFTNNSFLYGANAAEQFTKHYKLNQNINASVTNTDFWTKPPVTGYTGRGWTPIAGKSGQSFSGSFNGDSYAINGLTIHLRQGDNSKQFGLFGRNNGNITALGLQNINMIIQAPNNDYPDTTRVSNIVSAGSHAGGLVGLNQNNGIISYSYTTGLVNASMDSIGGLIGVNQGEISYSYSTATVQGAGDTGGLVGTNEPGVILSSYATGDVRGSYGIKVRDGTAGGLAGSSNTGSAIRTSYASGLVVDVTAGGPAIALGGVVAERISATIESSYWDSDTTSVPPRVLRGVGKSRRDAITDGDETGTTPLTTAQLQGCKLDGMVITGASPAPTTCANLFPSSNWGDDTDTSAGTDINRRWIFNAGEYPSLSAVRASDYKQLLPSGAEQQCQRNGMPLGCGRIEFVAVSGSEGSQYTPVAGATPANYDFAFISADSPAGYSVGNVSATDPDGDAIIYSISGGTDDTTLFRINSTTGEVTLKTIAPNSAEYQFNAIASNANGMETIATISVSVIDTTPPAFTPTTFNFDLPLSMANAPRVVVGKVSAVDSEGTPFDYNLTGSNAFFENLFELAAANNPDGSRNIILRRAIILSDFAAFPVTSQVAATHQVGGLSSEADVTVNLVTDSDGDGVNDFYDADPDNSAVSVTGNGESGTPYMISNIYQLQAIAGFDHEGTALGSSSFTNNSFLYGTTAAEQFTKHYKLANDIDATVTNNTFWNKPAVSGYIGRGWTPIAGKSGESFSGSFNGNSYAISELTIHLRQSDNSKHFGLFGINNGNITALGLQNINMIIQAPGNNYPGRNHPYSIETSNIVSAGSRAGGLVGLNQNNGIISYSYTTGLVNASMDSIGGLVGVNQGEISYSYSTATVQGEGDTGGLVGTNEPGVILSSYATGDVKGNTGIHERDGTAGGLAGSISGGGAIISASYASGLVVDVTPAENSVLGGVVAERGSGVTIESSYWDNETTSVPPRVLRGVGTPRTNIYIDGETIGTAPLTTAQLQGCELDGMVISGATPAPTTCATLFPSSNWGGNTTDGIIRSWVFNAGEYPSLNAVRSSDNKQLLPSTAEQECQRNGMPLGCGRIEFVAVSGSGQFTPAAGDTPANYDFINIPPDSLAGYSVGNVLATDPNGDAITYSITGGTDDTTLFQINPTTGEITLKIIAALIAEYTFNVIASDDNGMETTATIYVTIGDLTPPVFSSTPYNFNLDLSVANAAGVVVGKVSATDTEETPFTYSLAGSGNLFNDLFEFTSNPDGTRNIILRRAVILSDFATFPVTFQVEATHIIGGLSSEADVTVNLNNGLPLEDDSDADGIANFYDADPNDEDVNIIGNGEPDNPYIISNIYQLQAIAGVDHKGMPLDSSISTSYVFLYGTDAADQLTKHYKLNQNIDASNTTDTAVWAKPTVGTNNFIGHGWTPIAGGSGQSFNGSFAGEGYHIHNLNMNLQVANNKDTFGLFGTNGGNISAVGVTNINMQISAIDGGFTNSVSLAGGGETESFSLGSGALVGTNSDGGRIKYTYSTGIVTVDGLYTGGLVGVNIGKIIYSYSTATVTGRRDTGGLVGVFGTPVTISPEISSSYATGNVTAIRYNDNVRAGGLVGAMARIDSEISAKINATYTGQVENSVRYHEGMDPLGGPLVGTLTPNYNLDIFPSYWTNSTTNTFASSSGFLFSNTDGGFDFPPHVELSDRAQAYVTFDELTTCGLNQCTGFSAKIFASPHWNDNFDDPGIERGWLFQNGKYPALRADRSLNSVDTSLMPSHEAQDCHRRLASDACGTYDAVE